MSLNSLNRRKSRNPYQCGSVRIRILIGLCCLVTVQTPFAQETLRTAAQKRGINIGAAVGTAFWKNEAPYRKSLGEEFNILVAENAMKFAQIEPSRNNFRWSETDALVEFARQNGMQVRGHTLVWGNNGGYAETGNFGRAELLDIMKNHIRAVVGRYRGKILEWDVVNEAVADGTGPVVLKDNFWLRGIGQDYLDSAFHYAHQADPAALLIYNDYRAEAACPKADKIYALVRAMRGRGVPIHGVGMQAHMSAPGTLRQLPDLSQIDANMKRLAAIGIRVSITEFDFRVRAPASAQDLDVQKSGYQSMLGVCLANPNCKTFVTWGFTDKYSYVPGVDEGWGAALPFDEFYRAKPAYYGLLDALRAPVGILPGNRLARVGYPAPTGRLKGSWDAGGRWHSYAPGPAAFPDIRDGGKKP